MSDAALSEARKPYEGLRVVDLSQGVAGPHAAMLLGMWGAEVIKVDPLQGEWGRFIGRQYGEFCAHAVAFNRGKKGIAIDLKNPDGLAAARKLVLSADVVVENFRVGVMKRFGLDHESLRSEKPELIYCSVTGFGQTGPYAERGASDTILQAFSGLMSVNRDDQGKPQRLGMIAIDVLTGIYGAQAIGAALIGRFRFGEGRFIDCNMMQASAAFQAGKIAEHYLEGGEPQVLIAPAGTMPTKDGYINISGVKEEHYHGICRALGRPDLIDDPRFATKDDRIANVDPLLEIVHAEMRKETTAEWVRRLDAAGVMNAPVLDYADWLADPHVREVQAIVETVHAGIGKVPLVSSPGLPAFDADDALMKAPAIGEHSRDVLASLGYDEASIASMAQSGAIGTGPDQAASSSGTGVTRS